jgi:hypothetical protein
MGLQALMATRAQVLQLFGRIERLSGQVDEAFGGQAFMRNAGGPASPANRRRFNAYADCFEKVSGQLWDAIVLGADQWRRAGGRLDSDDYLHGPRSQGASKCESRCREGLAMRCRMEGRSSSYQRGHADVCALAGKRLPVDFCETNPPSCLLSTCE